MQDAHQPEQQKQPPTDTTVNEEQETMDTEIAVENNHVEQVQGQGEEQKVTGMTTNSPDIIPDHHSVNNNSVAPIIPDNQSVIPAPTNALQRPAVTWAPMDQELAYEKIRDQRRLLKKQHRAIKVLKHQVVNLKRKLFEMEQRYGPLDGVGQDAPSAAASLDGGMGGGPRRSSAGEHHPNKKARPCTVEEGSGVFDNVSLDDSETDPIPFDIKPSNLVRPTTKTYHPQQHQQPKEQGFAVANVDDNEDTPNTFKVKNQPVLDPYGDKGTYSGSVSNSSALPHGRGRMIYDDNQRVYSGGWNNGRWHGVGQAIFANGDTYQGDYHMDQRHGRGRYAWVDGRVYEGDFKADKRHGKGVFHWPDGARYEGEFVNGFRDGHGTYIFCGGCKYTGEWKDGRYSGVGSCIWTDGRCYSGEWRDGMRHGKGIETEEDGTVRHDGQWCNDEPVLTEAEKKMAAAKRQQRRSSAKTEKGRAQGWFRSSSSKSSRETKAAKALTELS